MATRTEDYPLSPARPSRSRTQALVVAFPASRALPIPASKEAFGRDHLRGLGIVDKQASSKHLAFTRPGGVLHVEDIGSRNGAWVDGVRLPPRSAVELRDGAVLWIGSTLLVVREDFQGPLEPSPDIGELVGPYGLRGARAAIEGVARARPAPGTDYWAAQVADYTDGAVNRPTGSDIIALNAGGQKVVTFSQAVINPFFAFSSWNGNTVDFSAPFTIVGQGCGHWGCGTFVPNVGNTGFTGSGEVHGVLQFQGTFTSISFTDVSENWHGFTVGAEGVSTGAVPEPATWAMMILGFGAAGAMLRRRRTAIA